MRLAPNTLVLVADGRKILLLRNDGTATDPNLTVEYGEEQDNPRDSEQKSDRAGQHPSGGGASQASAGENDYHQQGEDRFAAHAAELLNTRALKQDFDDLIVIAPPKTLGVLRGQYHKEVKDRLVAELPKAMTGQSTDSITQMLIAADA